MRLFLNRFVRAARLDIELYKEVVANPLMLNQAWIISAFVQLTLFVVLFQAFGVSEKPY